MEGKEGAGDPPELVARRLVGLVDAGSWPRGRVKFRFGFGFECGSLDAVEEVSMCRFTWSFGEVRLASAQGSDALVYDPGGGSVVACCDIILVSQRPAKTGDLRG